MNYLKILRKPYLSLLMASLILFVSCDQYDAVGKVALDAQTIKALQSATIDFLNNPENHVIDFDQKESLSDSGIDETLIEAMNMYVSDDLEAYKENVLSYSDWDYDQQLGIEAAFVVMTTVQDNYYQKGAWWAPLGFAAICGVVGILTIGIAGAACGVLAAAASSYQNYQNQ